MKIEEIFLSKSSIATDFIHSFNYPYEVLPHIKEYILKLGPTLSDEYQLLKENVWVHKSVKLSNDVEIHGPCIIDAFAEIRHNAFIRGCVIIGKNCVLGNSCEIKNAILYDFVQVPHFNYVGDSILGTYAHLGAGSVISNLKSDKKNVIINGFDTGLRKVGAFVGDYVEVGCGCVLNPGTIIHPHTNIYPLTSVRGIIEGNKIVKSMTNIVTKEEK